MITHIGKGMTKLDGSHFCLKGQAFAQGGCAGTDGSRTAEEWAGTPEPWENPALVRQTTASSTWLQFSVLVQISLTYRCPPNMHVM